MIRTLLWRRLHSLIALLGIAFVATVGTAVLTGGPAHAALVYQGTFTITSDIASGCVTVANNGTTRQTPIVMSPCNGSEAQRWAIFQQDASNYWILAYGGRQPLNMCMDKGNGDHMWIYNCNGGSAQRWRLSTASRSSQLIYSQSDNNRCAGFKNGSLFTTLNVVGCISNNPPFPVTAPSWTLVPA